jgi:tetratricopeptide (TPR) repeat protein
MSENQAPPGEAAGGDNSAEETPTFTVESDRPMSQSLVWRLQRNFYTQLGMHAWSDRIVPNYITSNTFIADAYARMVCGFARDCTAHGVDRDHPIYVVELGAGHGRFSYYFARALAERRGHPSLEGLRFVLVMTDLAERNIEHWEQHPQLAPLIAEGRLDFARFDVESDSELVLRHGDRTIAAGDLANPLVVIANYFFDSIPQDVFYIDAEHKLLECPVTLTSIQEENDLDDPRLLERLGLYFDVREIDADYYEEPELNQILARYRQRLSGSTLSFPCTALRCLDTLAGLAHGNMLLLTADKGHIHDESVLARNVPAVAVHGSISMDVNYHLIATWVRDRGGAVFAHQHHSASLNVSGFLLGDWADDAPETAAAFYDAVERFGPDDYFSIKKALEEQHANMSVRQVLALIRLSCFDPLLLTQCIPTLYKKLETRQEAAEIRRAIDRVWSRYYHLGEGMDLAFHIGTMLGQMGQFDEALVFFERSLELSGDDTSVIYNIGLCHLQLGDREQAAELAHRVLADDPEHAPAQKLLARAESTETTESTESTDEV